MIILDDNSYMTLEMFGKKDKESETVVVGNGGNQINLDSVNAPRAKWTTRGGLEDCMCCNSLENEIKYRYQHNILYGSVAKGTHTDESDVDIAVIVRSYTEEMHDKMIDLTVDLELEYNKVFSVLLIDYDNFKEWENVLPFYQNVKNDGIMLWSAA